MKLVAITRDEFPLWKGMRKVVGFKVINCVTKLRIGVDKFGPDPR